MWFIEAMPQRKHRTGDITHWKIIALHSKYAQDTVTQSRFALFLPFHRLHLHALFDHSILLRIKWNIIGLKMEKVKIYQRGKGNKTNSRIKYQLELIIRLNSCLSNRGAACMLRHKLIKSSFATLSYWNVQVIIGTKLFCQ